MDCCCPRLPITLDDIHDFPYLLYYEYQNWKWPKHWSIKLTPVEEEKRKQRIVAFNKVERFLWSFALSYRISIFLGFFFTITLTLTTLGGNLWDYLDPMPQPFKLSWGRRCGNNYPQYMYLFVNGKRVAIGEVYTKLDDLTIQGALEHVTIAIFGLPGLIMPWILFKGAYCKRMELIIYWVAWMGSMTVRAFFDMIIYGVRFIWASDIGNMLNIAKEYQISLPYLTFRHLLTFYPSYTFPFLLWVTLSIIIHYRSFTRNIPKAHHETASDDGSDPLLFARVF